MSKNKNRQQIRHRPSRPAPAPNGLAVTKTIVVPQQAWEDTRLALKNNSKVFQAQNDNMNDILAFQVKWRDLLLALAYVSGAALAGRGEMLRAALSDRRDFINEIGGLETSLIAHAQRRSPELYQEIKQLCDKHVNP